MHAQYFKLKSFCCKMGSIFQLNLILIRLPNDTFYSKDAFYYDDRPDEADGVHGVQP